MYSTKHTRILHTGSNQHNKPVNHIPKIGWASCLLPTKLGGGAFNGSYLLLFCMLKEAVCVPRKGICTEYLQLHIQYTIYHTG